MVDKIQALSRTAAAAIAMAGAAAMIFMGEINRLIASAVTPTGEARAFRAVIGPGAVGGTDAWGVWGDATAGGLIPGLVAWHTAADVVFYVAYGALLLRLCGGQTVARRIVFTLLVLEVAETLFLVTAALCLRAGSVPDVVRGIVAALAFGKWMSAGLLAVTALRSDALRQATWARVRLLAAALRYQRLSAVPLVLLVALSTIPGENLLDQLPDVTRGWVGGAHGWRHGLAAFAAWVVVALLLFVLGRLRARRAEMTRGDGSPPDQQAPRVIWGVGPVVVLVTAVLLEWRGPDNSVDWSLVALFVLVPVGLVVGGSLLVARWKGADLWDEPAEPWPALPAEVRRVGDALALAVIVAGGLGMVRAFTAPALAPGGVGRGWPAFLLVLGVSLAVATIPVGVRWVLPRLVSLVPAVNPTRWIRQLMFSLAAVAAGVLAVLTAAPAPVSRWLGASATMVTALGAWVVLVGFLIVYLQDHQTPEVFRLLHMRAAPVLTLFLLVPLVATLLPGQAGLHHVRTLDPGTAAVTRPHDLAATFAAWLTRSAACERDIGGTRVRPMLVVAASGGGIRSAVWTSSVLKELNGAGACGPAVTMLSSGVSGGSLGLVVARQMAGEDDALTQLAESDSLSMGLTGTLVGDLIAGMAGIRVPVAAGERDRPATWTDRAGLMEREWERVIPALAQPWTADVHGPGGALVLNSTAAGFGCRVHVSQVSLRLAGATADPANCRIRTGLPAASLDFFDTYGACSPQLRWSTAAMLSARFPTVTPAGRVPRPGETCQERPDLQLVDGGYAESSGVGTLAELAPDLMALVRDHNRAGGSVVVPLVAYFEDEVRSDVTVRPPDAAPEVFVPLVGASAKDSLATSAAHLQRLAQAFANPCPSGAPAGCSAAAIAIRQGLPDGVALVAPFTRPSVSAPLGWTLSENSRVQLANGLEEQLTTCTIEPTRYAGLARLLQIVNPAGGHCPA